MSKKVAVVLSGCGCFDGTDIHEASAVCVSISRYDKEPVMYAPYAVMPQVVNHQTGQSYDTERNVLVESARIARGKVLRLKDLDAEDDEIEAVIFPGGFGAANNLSTFGTTFEVQEEVKRVLDDFYRVGKPMAFSGMAVVLPSMVFPGVKISMQMTGEGWDYDEVVEHVRSNGAEVEEGSIDQVVVDNDFKVVSTPAFFSHEPKFHQVFDGISAMVSQVWTFLP